MYTRGLILIFISLSDSNLFSLITATAINGKEELADAEPQLSNHNKLIVLSLDGFRYDFMEKTETPTLSKLRSEGVHSSYMKPQFATKTFPNHQSIATGLYTENHGIIANEVFDPEYNEFLVGYVKYNEKFWNFRSDVVPVWILNEWAGNGRYSGVSWPGGNHPYGENKTFPSHYLTYNKSLSFEARMDYVIEWITDEEKPANLVFMYFDEPDGAGHAYGPESPEVIEQIQKVDSTIEYLLMKLDDTGIKDQINIIIVSDHGVHEVSTQNIISISGMADSSLYDEFGGNPVLQIKPKEGHFETVYNTLMKEAEGKNVTVYKKEELPEYWHYKHNRRVMPIVLVANVGYFFADYFVHLAKIHTKYNFSNDKERKYGAHGYDNREKTMRSFFLAYGPAFKKGIEINPFDNIDIFPLICKLMEITPAPNNGTLDIVGAVLK